MQRIFQLLSESFFSFKLPTINGTHGLWELHATFGVIVDALYRPNARSMRNTLEFYGLGILIY